MIRYPQEFMLNLCKLDKIELFLHSTKLKLFITFKDLQFYTQV
jgi:hypothetical protein